MPHQPKRVVNSRTAVRCIVYPVEALPVPVEEIKCHEVVEMKPRKKALPGTALLKKMMKDRERKKEKEKQKRDAARGVVDPEAVEAALAAIVADLEA